MQEIQQAVENFLHHYGYHAVPFALLYDPAGVPWAWIFLMLLAAEAEKNIWLMMFYGFGVMMFFDHILYWMGALGGRKLIRWVGKKRPAWRPTIKAARKNVRSKGALAVVFGRYLPFIGRWMGIGAGLAGMSYARFAIYDAVGSAISVFGFGLAAHIVGRKTIEHPQFFPVLTAIFVGSLLLGVFGIVAGLIKKRLQTARVS